MGTLGHGGNVAKQSLGIGSSLDLHEFTLCQNNGSFKNGMYVLIKNKWVLIDTFHAQQDITVKYLEILVVGKWLEAWNCLWCEHICTTTRDG